MRFSIKHLIVLTVILSLGAAWWFDHQKLSSQIDTLSQRELVRVIDIGYEPTFSIGNDQLTLTPRWKDPSSEPPISAAGVRRMAEGFLSQIENCEGSKKYSDIWLKSILLTPINGADSPTDSPDHWCYILDFIGHDTFPDEIKKSIPNINIVPRQVYRAAVLMDGTIYSCRQGRGDQTIRDEMLGFYPDAPRLDKDYVTRGYQKFFDERDLKHGTMIGGKKVTRSERLAQLKTLIMKKINAKRSQTKNEDDSLVNPNQDAK